ncbi:NAD(P)H-dependent oxidoreductase [Candidatus Woesebacteria bacterium]|nr:NAD(P)H-dependent oxidoreductase [Candidatus Woesebacteria bacterium]
MKNVYHIVTHPNLQQSRINKQVLTALEGKPGIETRKLYEAYPDWKIDVAKEKESLLNAEIIVVQTPFYWYSTPGLYKEWQDRVLEYGFAYGEGGDKLKGKQFQIVLSAFGPEEAYQQSGYNHFTIEELLRPLEQTANLCQMVFLKPLTLLGVAHKTDAEVTAFKDQVERTITALMNSTN